MRSKSISTLLEYVLIEEDNTETFKAGMYAHPAASLYGNLEQMEEYGKAVYKNTNWDVLEEPDLKPCQITNRPTFEIEKDAAERAVKRFETFKTAITEGTVDEETKKNFGFNEKQFKVAKAKLLEITENSFCSLAITEPCRMGKTRITLLILFCVLKELRTEKEVLEVLFVRPPTASEFTDTA